MLQLIKSRFSARNFTADEVSDADLKDMVEAAMHAPSAGDSRPWYFVVLKGDTLKQYKEINRNAAYNASAGILVCGDPKLEKYQGLNLEVIDCASATENILLAAHAKGFGSVWTHVFPEKAPQVRKLLNMPEGILPFALVLVGKPLKNTGERKSRYDEKRVFVNGWGSKFGQ